MDDLPRELDAGRTAVTLPQRFAFTMLAVVLVAELALGLRLAELGVSWSGGISRRRLELEAAAVGPRSTLLQLPVLLLSALGGIGVGIGLSVLTGQRLSYTPACEEGQLDTVALDRAAEAVVERCAALGFDVAPTDLADGGVRIAGKAAPSGSGHTISTREIEVTLTGGRGRVTAQVRVRFADWILVDTGETDYCRDVALQVLGRMRPDEPTPCISFPAACAVGYGLLAALPLMVHVPVGHNAALLLVHVGLASVLGVVMGLIGLGSMTLMPTRTHGFAVAVGGIVLSLSAPIALLLAVAAPFSSG